MNLEQLLERNEAYNDGLTEDEKFPCILCARTLGQSILLNDQSFLCKNCYARVAPISDPERYAVLGRQHAVAKESRRLAKQAFYAKYAYRSEESSLFFGWVSLHLLFAHPGFLALTAMLLAVGYDKNTKNKWKLAEWAMRRDEWEKLNPDPPEPELRHFHDATAGPRPRFGVRPCRNSRILCMRPRRGADYWRSICDLEGSPDSGARHVI